MVERRESILRYVEELKAIHTTLTDGMMGDSWNAVRAARARVSILLYEMESKEIWK